MMAASHSERNYHLTLKKPHLFSTFLTEILAFWHEAAAHFLSLSFCSRRPIVTKQVNGDFLGQCKHNMATTRFRPLLFKDGCWVPGLETTKSQRRTEIHFFTKQSEY